jgi:hypothetical protein
MIYVLFSKHLARLTSKFNLEERAEQIEVKKKSAINNSSNLKRLFSLI